MSKETVKKKRTMDFDTKIRLLCAGVIVFGIIVCSIFSDNADGTMNGIQLFLIVLLGIYAVYSAWWYLRKKFSMTKAGAFIISSAAFTLLCMLVTFFSSNALLTILAIIFMLIGLLCLGCSAAYEIVRRNTEKEMVKDKVIEQRQAERYVDMVAPPVEEQQDFSNVDEYGNPLDENGDGISQDL